MHEKKTETAKTAASISSNFQIILKSLSIVSNDSGDVIFLKP